MSEGSSVEIFTIGTLKMGPGFEALREPSKRGPEESHPNEFLSSRLGERFCLKKFSRNAERGCLRGNGFQFFSTFSAIPFKNLLPQGIRDGNQPH